MPWPGTAPPTAAHADYLAWTEKATPQPGAVNFGEIVVWLRENLPADAIITNGAGNYSAWVHRFFRLRRYMQHIAPTSGSMGYGLPAAVGIEDAVSGADRRVPGRRRRFSDERAGVHDGGSIRPCRSSR